MTDQCVNCGTPIEFYPKRSVMRSDGTYMCEDCIIAMDNPQCEAERMVLETGDAMIHQFAHKVCIYCRRTWAEQRSNPTQCPGKVYTDNKVQREPVRDDKPEQIKWREWT